MDKNPTTLQAAKTRIQAEGLEEYLQAEIRPVIGLAGRAMYGDKFSTVEVESELPDTFFADIAESVRQWAVRTETPSALHVPA